MIFYRIPDGSKVDQHLRDMESTVHDLEVVGSNLSQVELGVRSTSVQVILEPKL